MPMPKNEWGPRVWFVIHTMAASYDPSNAKYFKAYMVCLTRLLPCPECKQHLESNLASLNIDNYLGSRESLFKWTYLLHEAVNNQLGKPTPSYDEVFKQYFG